MKTTTLNGLAWHRERMAARRARIDSAPSTVTAESIQASEQRAAAERAARLESIERQLGQDGRVFLVSCSSTKLDHAAPARELYTSPLFKKARALAEASGQPWLILSAKHGLVHPDTVLEPYDSSVAGKTAEDRRCWAQAVRHKLRGMFWDQPRQFVVFAGRAYSAAVEGMPAAFPLEGLQVGERLRELNRLLAV